MLRKHIEFIQSADFTQKAWLVHGLLKGAQTRILSFDTNNGFSNLSSGRNPGKVILFILTSMCKSLSSMEKCKLGNFASDAILMALFQKVSVLKHGALGKILQLYILSLDLE